MLSLKTGSTNASKRKARCCTKTSWFGIRHPKPQSRQLRASWRKKVATFRTWNKITKVTEKKELGVIDDDESGPDEYDYGDGFVVKDSGTLVLSNVSRYLPCLHVDPMEEDKADFSYNNSKKRKFDDDLQIEVPLLVLPLSSLAIRRRKTTWTLHPSQKSLKS